MRTVTFSRPSPTRNGPTASAVQPLQDLGLLVPEDDGVVVDARRLGQRPCAVSASSSRIEVGLPAVQIDRPGVALVVDPFAVDLAQHLAPVVPLTIENGSPAERGLTSRCGLRRNENRAGRRRRSCTSRPSCDQRGDDVAAPRPAGPPAPPLVSGSSAAAQTRCWPATSGFHGSSTAFSNSPPKNSSGWCTTYWSSASGIATSTTRPSLALPADPADPLPRRDQRARIADEDADVQPADVDPQLQRAGGEDRGQLAAEQAGFERRAAPPAGSPRGRARPRPRSSGSCCTSQVCSSSVTRRALVKAIVRRPARIASTSTRTRDRVGRDADAD